MESVRPLLELCVAVAAGLLIGIEREHRAQHEDEPSVGGARTYPLVALTGGLAMLLAAQTHYAVLAVAFVGIGAFLAISYFDDVRSGRDHGVTSIAAFFAAFLLGALAVADQVVPDLQHRLFTVLAVAVLVAAFLSAKPPLHAFAANIERADVLAGLKFLALVLLALPLLPDEAVGPFGVLNPFRVGLLVALIAAVDFASYVLVRRLGTERGLGLTGLVGGLASSTAVTLSVSGRARKRPQVAAAAALAVVLASTVMYPRVAVELALTEPALLTEVWLPLSTMAAAGVVGGWVLHRAADEAEPEDAEPLDSPFELRNALLWGGIFSAVLVGSKALSSHFGAGGTYLAGLLSGITDVDAITLSMGELARKGEVEPDVAGTTVVIAAASNTLAKGVMAAVVGGWRCGRRVLLAFAGMLVTGGLAVAAQRLL